MSIKVDQIDVMISINEHNTSGQQFSKSKYYQMTHCSIMIACILTLLFNESISLWYNYLEKLTINKCKTSVLDT